METLKQPVTENAEIRETRLVVLSGRERRKIDPVSRSLCLLGTNLITSFDRDLVEYTRYVIENSFVSLSFVNPKRFLSRNLRF